MESIKTLQNAIAQRQKAYHDALDRLAEDADDRWLLREAIELAGCLRRALEAPGLKVEDIHRAFGAPGDFGYGTPIGDALAQLYRAVA